jgi:hypothetical protein
VRTHSYGAFAAYRVVVGAAAVALFLVRARG